MKETPNITCSRCGRAYYDHEVTDVIEVEGQICTTCLVEELWLRVRDLQERLEALEDIIYLKKVRG